MDLSLGGFRVGWPISDLVLSNQVKPLAFVEANPPNGLPTLCGMDFLALKELNHMPEGQPRGSTAMARIIGWLEAPPTPKFISYVQCCRLDDGAGKNHWHLIPLPGPVKL